MRPALSQPSTCKLLPLLLALLAQPLVALEVRAQDEQPTGGLRKPPPPSPAEKPEAAPKPDEKEATPPAKGGLKKSSARKVTAEATQRRVALPKRGEYAARDVLQLATALTSLPVRIESRAIHKRKVRIPPRIEHRRFTLDELRVLLAVHGVYLFQSDDPDRGPHLVATTNPAWQPRAPRFVKVVNVPAERFREVWGALQAAIDTHNAKLGEKDVRAIGVPVPALGKILLRAPSRAVLVQLLDLQQATVERTPDTRRSQMTAYTGRFRKVTELQKRTLEKLTSAEREQVRFVVMRTGNRILIRAPGPLLERVRELFELFDQR